MDETAEKRRNIFQKLKNMHRNNQIDVIDIKNKMQRKNLLEKYSGSPDCVNKGSYKGLIQSRDMQKKLGDYITMSTHTWTHLIFKQYRETLPKSIEDTRSKLKTNKGRIEELMLAK